MEASNGKIRGLKNKNIVSVENENTSKKYEAKKCKNKLNKLHVINKNTKTIKNSEIDQDILNDNSTISTKTKNIIKKKKYKKKLTLYTPVKELDKLNKKEKSDNNSIVLPERNHNKQEKFKKNKKKMLDSTNVEYTPGMLSDSIQIRKYGCVIIPWDPSFGLDKTYKIPTIDNENLPQLKINPLFDLSKREDIASQPLNKNNQRTIFVGNLPSNMTVSEIKRLFRKCGLIHQLKIKEKKVNISKESTHVIKSALITFKQVESCEKALKLNGRLVKDHHIRVDKAKNTSKQETRRSVFVGNLAYKIEDEDLWKAFESCGDIEGVRIIRDEKSGIGKGYGYVNFKTEEAVGKALELDGLSILERSVRVRRSEVGAAELPKSVVKRKRGKKKKIKQLENFDGDESRQKKDQSNDNEEETVKSEPKQKKIKKHAKKLKSLENNDIKV